MFHIIEIVLEFIFLGTIETISSKQVPMILRILVATALLALYLGLFALLLVVGINTSSTTLIVVAFVVLILIAVLVFPKIKQVKSQAK